MKLVLKSLPEEGIPIENPTIHFFEIKEDIFRFSHPEPLAVDPALSYKNFATQQNVANSLALYFFETNLIDRFAACYEKEISNNAMFQQKILELSDSDNNCHSNEFLLKHLIENNKDCQFGEMKNKLFKEFDKILNDIMKIPDEESTENKTDLIGAKTEMIKEHLNS